MRSGTPPPTLLKVYARSTRSITRSTRPFYERYRVKRGLRNADGTGVIAGLRTSPTFTLRVSDGEKVADEGMLRYRGYDVYDLLDTSVADRRFNFEEVAYLLLMGELPTQEQLDRFIAARQGDIPRTSKRKGHAQGAVRGLPQRRFRRQDHRA